MKVKNVSARLHQVGGVLIAPGDEVVIPENYRFAINVEELKEVDAPATAPAQEDSKHRGRPAKSSQ